MNNSQNIWELSKSYLNFIEICLSLERAHVFGKYFKLLRCLPSFRKICCNISEKASTIRNSSPTRGKIPDNLPGRFKELFRSFGEIFEFPGKAPISVLLLENYRWRSSENIWDSPKHSSFLPMSNFSRRVYLIFGKLWEICYFESALNLQDCPWISRDFAEVLGSLLKMYVKA